MSLAGVGDWGVISVLIRPETAADRADIRALNERAFEGPVDAKLVDLLRAAGKASVSLVTSEYDAGDAFMILPLKDGALEGVRGLAQYAKEFGDV